jgi:hypothetical protein
MYPYSDRRDNVVREHPSKNLSVFLFILVAAGCKPKSPPSGFDE